MRPRGTASLLVTLLGVGTPLAAHAGDSRAFDVDHLQLAITSPEFLATEGAGPLRAWSFQVGAAWRYSTGALLADTPGGTHTLLESRSLLDVGGGVTLWRRFGLAAALPVLLQQSGEIVDGSAAIGDLRLVARVNAFEAGRVAGAVLLGLKLPTGDPTRLLGEGGPVFEPRFAAEWKSEVVRVGLNLGARLRDTRTLGDLTIGHEAFAAAAVGVRPAPWVDLFGELHADTALSDKAFQPGVTPVEVLAGLGGHYAGFAAQAAVGFGVVEGYGSPRVRVIVGLSYALGARPPAPPVVAAAPPAKKEEPPPAPVAEAEEEDDDEEEGPEEAAAEETVTVSRDFIVLADPVFFQKDRSRIRARFRAELLALARALNARPWIKKVWIEGHTDDTGPAAWNKQLSDRRARAVATFLAEHGVSKERVATLALGKTHPWFSNRQKNGRERNRRVTFFVERQESEVPIKAGAVDDKPRPEAGRPAVAQPTPAPGPAAHDGHEPAHGETR